MRSRLTYKRGSMAKSRATRSRQTTLTICRLQMSALVRLAAMLERSSVGNIVCVLPKKCYF